MLAVWTEAIRGKYGIVRIIYLVVDGQTQQAGAECNNEFSSLALGWVSQQRIRIGVT